MRVNPNYVWNLASALDQTTSLEQSLTQQLSSGLRVTTLADDPLAVGRNVFLNAALGQDVTFSRTASSTESMLQVTDSALGSVVNQLTSAISLATQANNGTLNASNIKAIGDQLAGIRDEVVALANTTYMGQYLFSGSKVNVEPFALDTTSSPAVATYQGDNNVSYLQTPNGQKIQLNVPGSQIFSSAGNDVLSTLNSLVADFSSGSASSTSQADTAALTQVMNFVSQQRVTIDNSITRLEAAATYTQAEATQLTASQTNLMQADVATVATRLSTAEAQQTALSNVIASLGKGSLFDYL
jgi:flagellar hook-associated protein 3 FlgL